MTPVRSSGPRGGDLIRERTGTIASADGTSLFYRAWSGPTADSGDAVVVVHGIGLHSAPYRVVAEALMCRGHHVIGVDLRGHGRSGGSPGTVPGPREIREDLDAVVDWLKADAHVLRVHLLGESMGGLVALDYAAGRHERLHSLVLVAPAIRLAWGQLLRLENLALVTSFIAPGRPVVDLAGARLDEASGDAGFKRDRRADSLAHNVVSARYLLALARLRAGWRDKAQRTRVPTLIFHGRRDAVLDWRGSRALHAALGAAIRELLILDEARHTLFWDPAAPRVFAQLRRWLAARAG